MTPSPQLLQSMNELLFRLSFDYSRTTAVLSQPRAPQDTLEKLKNQKMEWFLFKQPRVDSLSLFLKATLASLKIQNQVTIQGNYRNMEQIHCGKGICMLTEVQNNRKIGVSLLLQPLPMFYLDPNWKDPDSGPRILNCDIPCPVTWVFSTHLGYICKSLHSVSSKVSSPSPFCTTAANPLQWIPIMTT